MPPKVETRRVKASFRYSDVSATSASGNGSRRGSRRSRRVESLGRDVKAFDLEDELANSYDPSAAINVSTRSTKRSVQHLTTIAMQIVARNFSRLLSEAVDDNQNEADSHQDSKGKRKEIPLGAQATAAFNRSLQPSLSRMLALHQRDLVRSLPDQLSMRLFDNLLQQSPGVLGHTALIHFFYDSSRPTVRLTGSLPLRAPIQTLRTAVGGLGGKNMSLRRLDLSGMVKIGDTALASLIRHLPNLQEVTIRGCARVGDESVIALARTVGAGLRILNANLTSTTWKGLSEVVGRCENLEVLKVANVRSLTDKVIWEMVTRALQVSSSSHSGSSRSFIPLSNLRSLKLRHTEIGASGLGRLLELCGPTGKLEKLDIGNTQVGPEGLEVLGIGLGMWRDGLPSALTTATDAEGRPRKKAKGLKSSARMPQFPSSVATNKPPPYTKIVKLSLAGLPLSKASFGAFLKTLCEPWHPPSNSEGDQAPTNVPPPRPASLKILDLSRTVDARIAAQAHSTPGLLTVRSVGPSGWAGPSIDNEFLEATVTPALSRLLESQWKYLRHSRHHQRGSSSEEHIDFGLKRLSFRGDVSLCDYSYGKEFPFRDFLGRVGRYCEILDLTGVWLHAASFERFCWDPVGKDPFPGSPLSSPPPEGGERAVHFREEHLGESEQTYQDMEDVMLQEPLIRPITQTLLLDDTSVGDDALKLSPCRELRVLSLARTKVTDESIFNLLDVCPNLHTIDLTSCRGIPVADRRNIFQAWERRKESLQTRRP